MASPAQPEALRSRFSAIRAELRPRWKEVRYSLHLLRKSPLAVVGFSIVGIFLFLTVAGPVLAPYVYQYTAIEKNCPPWSRCVILANRTSLEPSGTGWNGTQFLDEFDEGASYNTATNQCTVCGLYATSKNVGDALYLRRFSLQVSTDLVQSVGIKLQYNSSGPGGAGNTIDVAVSWDNGTTWSGVQRPPLRFSDADGAFYSLDFTSATAWTAAKLSDQNFTIRIVHALAPGYTAGPVGIDVVWVLVKYQGAFHSLGTTTEGEDLFSGLLLGARISMRIGIIVVTVSTLVGSILGALAGYYGGPLDEIVMRITDVFLAIPGLILALAVVSALGRNLDNVMYALIVVSWPPYTRLVRGQALSVRENLYIEASRATGASEMRVVTRHVLPNAISPILVQASLDAGSIVLVAAGLSYLGLGAQPGTPEWGLMVSTGFTFFPQNWWQVTFSGLMIFMFVMGFNLLGDGVRDILDPRLRR